MFRKTTTAPQDPGSGSGPRWTARLGLSGKLFGLTIVAIMLAEVIFYVPSIASFRIGWLNDRLAAAHTAAIVLKEAPKNMVLESLSQQLLESIGARMVAMRIDQQRRVLATSDVRQQIRQDVDMRNLSMVRSIVQAFDTLLDCRSGGQRNHREIRESRANRPEDVEAVLAGERQVEQDERVVAGQRGRLSARAIVTESDSVAVRMEGLLHEPRQRAFVFDHQDSHPDSRYALMQAKSDW